jgi:hypothetical protein
MPSQFMGDDLGERGFDPGGKQNRAQFFLDEKPDAANTLENMVNRSGLEPATAD